jgi:hypothetical protein
MRCRWELCLDEGEEAALPSEMGDGRWEMGGSRLKAGLQNGERGVAALPRWGASGLAGGKRQRAAAVHGRRWPAGLGTGEEGERRTLNVEL